MLEEAIMAGKKQKLFGIVICLYMGLRIGELLALTWDNVDFEKGELMYRSPVIVENTAEWWIVLKRIIQRETSRCVNPS